MNGNKLKVKTRNLAAEGVIVSIMQRDHWADNQELSQEDEEGSKNQPVGCSNILTCQRKIGKMRAFSGTARPECLWLRSSAG